MVLRKFEYYWILFDFTQGDMEKIDELGEEGWELVTIVEVPNPLKSIPKFFCAVLKRELKQEEAKRDIKSDCVHLEKCLKYLEMTLDPESEVLTCKDCPAYQRESLVLSLQR